MQNQANKFDADDIERDTIDAIAKADEQYAAGDYVEWRDVREELRKRYIEGR